MDLSLLYSRKESLIGKHWRGREFDSKSASLLDDLLPAPSPVIAEEYSLDDTVDNNGT
jgi:hypothetical protein